MSEAIAAKLDEARALIEKGWCQHHAQLGERFCSFGALSTAYYGQPQGLAGLEDCQTIYDLFADVVGGKRRQFSLVSWNDAPERTQTEVIEAFRKAAELARGDLVDPLEQVKP